MNSAVMFARALADETRWRIVRLVMDQAFCVCELADILEMPQSPRLQPRPGHPQSRAFGEREAREVDLLPGRP